MSDFFHDVSALVRRVGQETVLPRWRQLSAGDISEKMPGDFVTIVDVEAESILAPALAALLPDALVIGEEAVAAEPALLDRIGEGGDIWVIDPIDGTGNFIDGKRDFAVMVGLIRNSVMEAGWIYMPVSDDLYSAQRGGGAWRNGNRMSAPVAPSSLQGARVGISTRYTPDDLRPSVMAALPHFASHDPFMCAGCEYAALARGDKAMAMFHRLLPWDHVPGLLLAQETGQVLKHLDGSPYAPSVQRTGLIVASNAQLWQEAVDLLVPPQLRQ